jgi:butyryl-CoA dehydrogenase
MHNGKGLELLAAEIMQTIMEASKDEELKGYAAALGDTLKLSQKVIGKLMPFAMKGNYERYLSDANLFMEYMSIVVVGWLWLEMAVDAKKEGSNPNRKYSETFYESKIHTMKFYFKYEVPKTNSLAASLMSDEVLTIKNDKEYII